MPHGLAATDVPDKSRMVSPYLAGYLLACTHPRAEPHRIMKVVIGVAEVQGLSCSRKESLEGMVLSPHVQLQCPKWPIIRLVNFRGSQSGLRALISGARLDHVLDSLRVQGSTKR